jgi:uncharacterized protein
MLTIVPSTKVHDLIEKYPFLLDFLVRYNPAFELLRKKTVKATMGRVATLSMASSLGGIPVDTLISALAAEIKAKSGDDAEISAESSTTLERDKLDRLKDIIRDLHKGEEFSEVKGKFDTLLGEIEPSQIAEMEEELIREGMPAQEIQRLCDLHVSVFQSALDEKAQAEAPEGHPVNTYMAENAIFSDIVCSFDSLVQQLVVTPAEETFRSLRFDLTEVADHLAQVEIHYTRKENQLFPFLEKHNITGPSQVMWGIHDEIRAMIKSLGAALEADDITGIIELGPKISRAITEMIYKENTILFPLALDTIGEEEWHEIRAGEDDIGYAFAEPSETWKPVSGDHPPPAEAAPSSEEGSAENIRLDTGVLSQEQITLLLKNLPFEMSFVDEHDKVQFYSDTADRIFPRSPGVIGRKIQNCHPPKSLDTVNRIIESFRNGSKDHADFRIDLGGKYLLIRYFAVRDAEGVYKGIIEVTQDITDIRGMSGERRLLDWDE